MKKKERKKTRDAEGSIIKSIVERRTSGGHTRKVTIYYARVRMNEYDEKGSVIKKHERKVTCDSYQEAIYKRKELRSEIIKTITEAKAKISTKHVYYLNDLFEYYRTNYVKPAKYIGNKKVSGQRSPISATLNQMMVMQEFLKNPSLSSISYDTCFELKKWLSSTPYSRKRKSLIQDPKGKKRSKIIEVKYERKPATIHRYLALFRRILSVGVQRGWLAINPFSQGDPLIIASIEEERERYCSFEEEYRIYQHCTGRRSHLRDVIICAIDTFLRENEMFSLKGCDINFECKFLNVQSLNSKTQKTRTVPLSDRVIKALKRLKGNKSDDEWNQNNIFEYNRVYSAWYSALKAADITDLRYHDLRGTGITRMLQADVPIALVMKYSGHTQYKTFQKYIKKDIHQLQNHADAITKYHQEQLSKSVKGHLPLGQDGQRSLGDTSEFIIIDDISH